MVLRLLGKKSFAGAIQWIAVKLGVRVGPANAIWLELKLKACETAV
jgi:hypothetical protein